MDGAAHDGAAATGMGTALGAVAPRADAMDLDAYRSTHPVVSRSRARTRSGRSFDAITYSKAAAVIAMIEAYVGADTWREGVRRYIAAHAYGNTRSDELWQAISAAAGRPIDDIAGDFTLQPGIPLVRLERSRCDSGQTTIELTQGEFSNDHPDGAAAWRVPVIARVAGEAPARTLLDGDGEPRPAAVAARSSSTPARPATSAPGTRRTSALPCAAVRCLAVIDQLGVIDDFWALALAGRMPIDEALDLVARVPADADATLWASIAARFAPSTACTAASRCGERRGADTRSAGSRPCSRASAGRPRADEPVPVAALRGELIDTLGTPGRRGDARRSAPALRGAQHRPGRVSAAAAPFDPRSGGARRRCRRLGSLHAAARSERDTLAKERLYRLLASAAEEGLAGRALELAIGDEPGATSGGHGRRGRRAASRPGVRLRGGPCRCGRAHGHDRPALFPAASRRTSLDPATAAQHRRLRPGPLRRRMRFGRAPGRCRRRSATARQVARDRLQDVDAWLRARP